MTSSRYETLRKKIGDSRRGKTQFQQNREIKADHKEAMNGHMDERDKQREEYQTTRLTELQAKRDKIAERIELLGHWVSDYPYTEPVREFKGNYEENTMWETLKLCKMRYASMYNDRWFTYYDSNERGPAVVNHMLMIIAELMQDSFVRMVDENPLVLHKFRMRDVTDEGVAAFVQCAMAKMDDMDFYCDVRMGKSTTDLS